ncbi:hypothetical protein PMI11_04321 [Rhizobium sp. CF142]|nr:hypothetical protein PMI11_04321 [Rhizobium sp. CF142]
MRRYFVSCAVAAAALVSFQSPAFANDAEGLEIGQMKAVNGTVEMRISNLSEKADDIVVWVADGDSRYCERITNIGARKWIHLKFFCESITPQSQLRIGYAWSERVPRIASVAKRID